jgi:deoxyribose-phosphate aldolase
MNTNEGMRNLASFIDHTILKPEATEEQVQKLCNEAKENGFASVCISPSYVTFAAKELSGSSVKVCTVIGFPLGATTTAAKAAETREAVENGAAEVDMVINIGFLKSGKYDYIRKDIEGVVKAAKPKALVKVIIETCLLTDEEKVKVCTIAKEAGADFVKTSTGFSTGGAAVEDVKLMRQTVGPEIGVKASAAIRDYETAVKMIEAGATRLGTSASIAIINGDKNVAKGY